MRRLLSLALLFGFLCVPIPGAAAQKAAEKPKPPPSTIVGWIDSSKRPAGSSTLDVVGWAADARSGSPVAKVELLLNGKVVGTAQTGEARRDVAQVMKRSDFLKSGWKARLELKGMKAGTYRLTARAWNNRGESAPLNTGPLDVRIP
ncbi:MAG: hypothetical protein ABI610_05950 [Acidobacteriota bacterium]